MSIRLPVPFLAMLIALGCTACGSSVDGGGDDADAGPPVLQVTPATVTLEVVNGVQVEQAYTVMATTESGELEDVTDSAAFAADNPLLGVFSSQVFRTIGVAGGNSKVRVVYGSASATADITVLVKNDRVEDGVPDNAPNLFDSASDDPALAPSLVYPQTEVYMPPNLGDFEAHWTSAAATDLYELSLASEYAETRLYTAQDASAGAFGSFTPEEWSVVGESARGSDVTIRVRALNSAAPQTVGASEDNTVHLTDTDIKGGIYYWAAAGQLPGGIYRHDMSRPGEEAEVFYTTGESPAGRCVACHVLSRDGDKMAITYDGGNGAGSIVDVATRQPILATDGTFNWNFASFEPSGNRILTVYTGVVTLRDAATGDVVNTVPTEGYASHVDFAPSGDAIVYAAVASPSSDWRFTGGSLVVQSFDASSAMWGTPTTLYQPPVGTNAYYPSYSPDGQWVLFNQSTADSYDVASAELYVIRSDGSGQPIKLDSPNVEAGLTNSWARWAPFTQVLAPDEESPEEFFWLTFSSKRAFGVRLPQGTPQLWMSAFFPTRASAGGDAAGPAFRLPFQEISTNNHIAQWTTQVIPID